MKAVYIFGISILLISCKDTSITNEKTISDSSKAEPATVSRQQDSLSWIQSFREFRDAVYQDNKTKVKSFFDFPVMNENNEIWYLVYGPDQKLIDLLPGNIKPFMESDFDKYFQQLFSKRFIKSILKIRSEDLAKKNETETAELKDGNATTYKMYAVVDKVERTLTLHLSNDTEIKDENGEIQDGGEFSIFYIFNIIENRRLKFKQVRLAG